MNMAFHEFLYTIAEQIDSEDLAALKFLSLDCISLRKYEEIRSPLELFITFEEKGLLAENDLFFLKELFFYKSRNDLLRQLNTDILEMKRELGKQNKSFVSPYRILLFNILEDVPKSDLKTFKFLLWKKIPKSKLQDDMTLIDILLEMEKQGILGKENLDVLKKVCSKIDKNLLKKIEDFES